MYMWVHTYIYIYIYICMYTYIYIYIYTYVSRPSCDSGRRGGRFCATLHGNARRVKKGKEANNNNDN